MRADRSVLIESHLSVTHSTFVATLRKRLDRIGIATAGPEEADLRVLLLEPQDALERAGDNLPTVALILGGAELAEDRNPLLPWPLRIPLPSSWEPALRIAVPLVRGLLEVPHRWGAEPPETEILSREMMAAALDVQWRRGLRSGEPISIALFDCGDVSAFDEDRLTEATRHLAHRARRAGDFAFRYDSSTLGVVMAGCPVEDAEAFAGVLAEDLGGMIMGEAEALNVACVGRVPQPGTTPEALIEKARLTLSGVS